MRNVQTIEAATPKLSPNEAIQALKNLICLCRKTQISYGHNDAAQEKRCKPPDCHSYGTNIPNIKVLLSTRSINLLMKCR